MSWQRMRWMRWMRCIDGRAMIRLDMSTLALLTLRNTLWSACPPYQSLLAKVIEGCWRRLDFQGLGKIPSPCLERLLRMLRQQKYKFFSAHSMLNKKSWKEASFCTTCKVDRPLQECILRSFVSVNSNIVAFATKRRCVFHNTDIFSHSPPLALAFSVTIINKNIR
jgi:hypothetical protein